MEGQYINGHANGATTNRHITEETERDDVPLQDRPAAAGASATKQPGKRFVGKRAARERDLQRQQQQQQQQQQDAADPNGTIEESSAIQGEPS
jgi:hypothetical protein